MNKNKKESKSLTKTDKKGKEEIKEKKLSGVFKRIIEVLKKRWLINTYSTLLLILIIFGIYFAGTTILDKVNIPDIDCTENKIHTISNETKERLKDLDKDVKITLINYSNSDSMDNIMKQYEAISKKITIERIDDLSDRLDLQQKYNIEQSDSLILVSSGDQEIELTAKDLFSFDYTTYQDVDLTEEAVTNAIVNVIADYKPVVYFMNNHVLNDIENYESIIKALEGDANTVNTINLLSAGGVPSDCETLIITTLREDISTIEKDYIINYINKGGNLLLMCGPNVNNVNMKNFDEILDLYGIKYKQGVIFEGDSSKMLYEYPMFIIEEFGVNSVTNNKNLKLTSYLTSAGEIEIEENYEIQEEKNVEYETLLTTSDQAFLRTNFNIMTADRTSLDSEPTILTLGVLATKKIDEEKTSKLIMYSDEMFDVLSVQYYAIQAGNNQDIVLNSVAYLNKNENKITIRKNYDQATYSPTEQQHDIIMRVIFITPFVIILLGIIVRIKRRKNK